MSAERRSRTLSDADVEAIAHEVSCVLSVREETHREHHEFITALIRKEEQRGELYEKLKAHVIGWAVIGAITGLGYAVLLWARRTLAS